jgi:hypothetical protein
MPIEPLSDTTRVTKRNLLLAGTLAITYRAFDVTVERIPIGGGLVVDFNKGVFAFLLTIVLIYFLVSFALYFFIDVKNIEDTSHQKTSAQLLANATNRRIARFLERAASDARTAVQRPYKLVLSSGINAAMFDYLSRSAKGRTAFLSQMIPNTVYELHGGPFILPGTKKPPEHEVAKEAADKFVMELFRTIPLFDRTRDILAWSRYRGVGAVYILRSYIVDGLLPLALGVAGILAMYQLLPLDWLRHIAPPQ